MNWITDRQPTREDADSNEDVWVSRDGSVHAAKYWSTSAQDLCDAWTPKAPLPEPYAPPAPKERTFFEGTTYAKPGVWIAPDGTIIKGPVAPNDNLHFAVLDGISAAGEAVWTLIWSAMPEDMDVVRAKEWNAPIESEKPKRWVGWMMSEPIRDRRPTESDGNTMETVLAWVKGEWLAYSYAAVKSGIWWRPIDQTPPPEPEPKRRHMTGGNGTKWISVLPGDPPDLDALLEAIDNRERNDLIGWSENAMRARHGEGGEGSE